ncbi:MAG: D-cysteine desulfhydrase family protein [Kiritimatiellae bacterium]|nr:D-cysteine desulfhydrase family protein [Kiritimatiellia bacterium]MDD5522032.1 D-cysteine desulfhydrase family protein [Kiritimatiellia bacterium]
MGKIDEKLTGIARQRCAILPTPVHELLALSKMSKCRVFCKRDDLTGFGFGGNKARKLDFLISDAIQSGCNTLLAVGASQSNFCRMVAAYGSAYGMDVHLLLGGRKPDISTGNLLLDHMLGTECHHVDSGDWNEWEAKAAELEVSLRKEGRTVYRMPIGGSTAIGALGYVEAMSEILNDEKRLGLHFDAVVFASSSAGTQAGLVVGKSIANWPGQVIGFSVAKEQERQQQDVFNLARETAIRFGVSIDKKTICVDDSCLGAGYAKHTKACEDAVQLFARKYGIFLDYVYTGKAAAGLLDYLKADRFVPGSAILFLHTGGNVELFA